MSTPNLRAEIILIARDWAKQYGVGEDKARVLVDRIWPVIQKASWFEPDAPGEGKPPEPSGPTKE